MKVLMISEYFPPNTKGGGELSAYALAKSLASKDIDLHVLTSFSKDLPVYETKESITYHRTIINAENPNSLMDTAQRQLFFEKNMLKAFDALKKKHQFDIVHCMNITSTIAITKKTTEKFILHVNSPLLFCPKGNLWYKEREICNYECTFSNYMSCISCSSSFGKLQIPNAVKFNPLFIWMIRKKYNTYMKYIKEYDEFCVISADMKKRLLKLDISEEKIHIIYNIVALDRFFDLSKNKNKIKRIAYFGGMYKHKGVMLLLNALEQIKESYHSDFYGDGPLLDQVKEKIDAKRLPIKVHAKLHFDNVAKAIQQSDIVIIPSLWVEALGRIAIEACAAKKIVIASESGGLVDVVKDAGYLFDPQNPNELQNLIKKALNNEITVPKNIQEIIKKRFNKEDITQKVIEVYNGSK